MPALARHVAFEVDHLATAMGLVLAGLGISIVPAMTLFHFQRPGLTILPLAGDALTRSLYVVHRQGRTFSSAAQALYDEVIQTCATKVAG